MSYSSSADLESLVALDKETALTEVLVHCDMLLHNMRFEYNPELVALGVEDHIPVLLNQFTFMHLFTTMFAVDNRRKQLGGACYELLEPHGLAPLLDEISEILDLPVGQTTFGRYVKTYRNKLAVHGNLGFENLPPSIQAVLSDESALIQYHEASHRFHVALVKLRYAADMELRKVTVDRNDVLSAIEGVMEEPRSRVIDTLDEQ